MKCPNDQSEMEVGSFVYNGTVWKPGAASGFFKPWFGRSVNNFVNAWKCPKCGKIELKVEVKEEK